MAEISNPKTWVLEPYNVRFWDWKVAMLPGFFSLGNPNYKTYIGLVKKKLLLYY